MRSERPLEFKRILICRTDRMGDVILSTPVIKALRDWYPSSYIAVMAAPETSALLKGNPYLDELIVLNKRGEHKGLRGILRLISRIKKRRFDLAVILHSTNRVNFAVYFAGIPVRIGYARRAGFLLTRKLPYIKPQGRKHELEYCLDVLKLIGIDSREKELFVPLEQDAEGRIRRLLRENNVCEKDKFVIIHPSASCISRIWPEERFAELANRLIDELEVKVAVISNKGDKPIVDGVVSLIKHPVLNLAGELSLGEMVSLLRWGSLFISNDSGPAHIASAVGTPVVSIFGRKQPGLGPLRWRPLGEKVRVLQKDVGCIECLAHNCVKHFACLKAITVDDVFAAAKELLKSDIR
ncbi:MAG: lipopolysaccharide heptosyltransferase II [Candidatus Omnitrophica bacterium]|nr:lipopolysaccharide heptosyltransferase II [Candidatus Omnitrophota bacterium]